MFRHSLFRIFSLFALVMTGSALAMADDAAQLVGTWRLASAEYRLADGSLAATDWGDAPEGRIFYDAGGNMAAQLSRTDRPRFASSDRRNGTTEEYKSAFDSFIAYFGTYTVDTVAKTVTHKVRACSFQNWVGTDQRRFYRLDGDTLTLSTPPYLLGGQMITGHLIWKRITP